MAGGSGTRFWPESTRKRPKQYLEILQGNSLLSQTLHRFDHLIGPDKRFVITVEDQLKLAKAHSEGRIHEDGIFLEPEARNTAPCLFYSFLKLLKRGCQRQDVIVVVPADHVILNRDGFQRSINQAISLARSKSTIVTVGIPPHCPHTGYGYIEKGDAFDSGIHRVKSFKEKPTIETAASYITTGNFLWNAGIFVSSIGTFLDNIREFAPDIYQHREKLEASLDVPSKLKDAYGLLPKISIDYAVMEKSTSVSVVTAAFDWSDLGSWDALEGVLPKVEGNTLVSCERFFAKNAQGNIVFSKDKLVALLNVHNLIVVNTEKALLIAPKSDAQDVRSVVEWLSTQEDGISYL